MGRILANDPIIIFTRPRKASERFCAELGWSGPTVFSPLLDIEFLKVDIDFSACSGVIFSSENAIRAIEPCGGFHGKNAFAVGVRTAERAISLGFNVAVGDGNADQLVDLILQSDVQGKLLYPRGRHASGQIAQRLIAQGLDVTEVIVYEQHEVPLSAQALAALSGTNPVLLPVFSARTAQILSKRLLATPPTAPIHLISISNQVAESWDGPDLASSVVAENPSSTGMKLMLMRRLADIAR